MTQNIKIKDAKYKGVIFDLDGTVADTIGDITNAMNLMRNSFGLDAVDENEVVKHINLGAINALAGNLPESYREEQTLNEALTRYLQFYSEHFIEKTRAFDGIENALKVLYENGFKICVLSNKSDKLTKAIVGELFQPEYFIEVLGASERFPHKPDPASAIYLAGEMGLSSGEVILVGDSDIDMQTANNAGMLAVGVAWGYRSREVLESAGARLIINEPHELIEFLKTQ